MASEGHFCFLTSKEKGIKIEMMLFDFTYFARFPDMDGEFPVLDKDALGGVHDGDGLRYSCGNARLRGSKTIYDSQLNLISD